MVSAASAIALSGDGFGRAPVPTTEVVVTLMTSMEFLTNYAVSVALPDIQGDLAASFDEGSWILTTYTTCFIIGLMMSNWLSASIGFSGDLKVIGELPQK